MNKRSLYTGLFLVVAVLTQAATALSQEPDASLMVLARGPAGLRIEAKSTNVSVSEDATMFTFEVPIALIDTGIDLRNRHMREALEADKFPDAILRVDRSQLAFPKDHQPVDGTAKGDLTLHGQSRPVEVHYHAEHEGGGVTRVRGSMQLDLRNFDVTPPSYLGVKVDPQVEVDAELAMEGT